MAPARPNSRMRSTQLSMPTTCLICIDCVSVLPPADAAAPEVTVAVTPLATYDELAFVGTVDSSLCAGVLA